MFHRWQESFIGVAKGNSLSEAKRIALYENVSGP